MVCGIHVPSLAIATDIGCYLSEYVNNFVEKALWRREVRTKVKVRRNIAGLRAVPSGGFDKLNQQLE